MTSAPNDGVRMASDYASRSDLQSMVAKALSEVLREAVQEHSLPSPYAALDCGVATGLQSSELCKVVLESLPASDDEIHWVLNDTPSNDWNTLFGTVAASLKETGRAFFSGVGKSMYGPLMPSSSLSLVVSSTALHWYGGHSLPLSGDHFFSFCEESPAATTDFLALWSCFLHERLRELKSGGLFVASIPTAFDRTSFIYALTEETSKCIMSSPELQDAHGVRLPFTRGPIHLVSLEERLATITDTPRLAAGFRVLLARDNDDPITPWYQNYLQADDKAAAAQTFVTTAVSNLMMGVAAGVLTDALEHANCPDIPARLARLQHAIVDAALSRFQAAPSDVIYPSCTIVLQKV